MRNRNSFYLFLTIIMFVLVLLCSKPAMAYPNQPVHNVPEPSSLVMLASGLVGLGGFVRLRRRK